MTETAAISVITTLQRDQKKAKHHIFHRDFQLLGHEQRSIQLQNGYLILLFADDAVTIDSDLGIYDRLSVQIGEVQHVHSGQIVLKNYCDTVKNAELWEVIFS